MKRESLKNTILLLGLKINPKIIRFIENPTEKMKFTSIKRNGLLIKHISNPSKELIEMAYNQNEKSYKFISNPTNKMILNEIKKNPIEIKSISNPTREMKIVAIQSNPKIIGYIQDVDKELEEMALKLDKYCYFRVCNDHEINNFKVISLRKKNYAYSNVLIEKINNENLFSCALVEKATKEEFKHMILSKSGRLNDSICKDEYLKILEQF